MVTDEEFQELKGMVESIMRYFEQAPPPDSLDEVSFPVADQGVSQDQWAHLMKGFGSGVISYGQYPYQITNRDDVTNEVTISPATDRATKDSVGIIEGYVHILNNPKKLKADAVTERTRYIIALQYDPQRTGPEGPVTLGCFAGTLDQTQGKKYILLYEGYRDPSTVLTSVEWTPVRSRLAPTITVAREAHLPNALHSGLIWGTRCRCNLEGSEWMLQHNESNPTSMRWVKISGPVSGEISIASGRTAMNSTRIPRSHLADGMVTLTGGVRATSGNSFGPTSDGHSIGRLIGDHRPPYQMDLPMISYSDSPSPVRIRITETGYLTGFPAGSTTTLLLDGITFPAVTTT